MRGFIPPQNREETVFCRQMLSLCEKSSKLQSRFFTHFLDLRQRDLLISQRNKLSDIQVCFYSGFEGDCERVMACICPEYDQILQEDWPISLLYSKIDPDDKLIHRDFLGAAMGLMIKREYIGDIIICPGECYIACHDTMAPIIISELKGVRRSYVDFDYFHHPLTYKREYTATKSVTVASLRADGVLSAVLKIGRSAAADIIKQGKLSVNHLTVKRNDFEIASGDVLSIRGHGKYSVLFDGEKSRKDRFFITYNKY